MKKYILIIRSKRTNIIISQKEITSPNRAILDSQKTFYVNNWLPLTIAQREMSEGGIYVESKLLN